MVLSERDRFEGIINVKIRVGLRLDPLPEGVGSRAKKKGCARPFTSLRVRGTGMAGGGASVIMVEKV
jgi:hypothetical protein